MADAHAHAPAAPGKLHVEIVTPKGRVDSVEVDEIVAPGALGEFGVLPGHVAFLTALKPGVITLKIGRGALVRAVGPGYVEVGSGNRVVVLASLCEKPEQIDVAAAEAELRDASAKLAAWTELPDARHAALRDQAAWAEARLATHRAAQAAAHG